MTTRSTSPQTYKYTCIHCTLETSFTMCESESFPLDIDFLAYANQVVLSNFTTIELDIDFLAYANQVVLRNLRTIDELPRQSYLRILHS